MIVANVISFCYSLDQLNSSELHLHVFLPKNYAPLYINSILISDINENFKEINVWEVLTYLKEKTGLSLICQIYKRTTEIFL